MLSEILPSFTKEKKLWKRGRKLVFGIDEAGRGCLAGPVCAAIAAYDKEEDRTSLIKDSKKLKEEDREKAYQELQSSLSLWGLGFASHKEIDKWNILEATGLAVARALEKALEKAKKHPSEKTVAYLIDGKISLIRKAYSFSKHPAFKEELPNTRKLLSHGFLDIPIIKGDQISMSIASASILAKVSRDRLMRDLDKKYPEYSFRKHKGYPTKQHKELLKKHGPCKEHRLSFSPVRSLQ